MAGVLPYDQFDNGDTGACNPEAILPVANGEAANQTVFRRPTEILRVRTELVRQYMDWVIGLTDQCRGLNIVSDPSVMITWNAGTSKFTLSPGSELRIAPMLSSGTVTASNNIPAQDVIAIAGPPAGYFSIRSKSVVDGGPQSWEGANALKYKIYYVTDEGSSGGDPVITVTGSKGPQSGDFDPIFGPLLLSVKLSHNGGILNTRWSQVVTAINNDATASDFFYASVTAGGPDASYATTRTERYVSSTNGAVDSCAFRVQAATIASFFADAGSAGLADGDALFINRSFPYSTLGQPGGTAIAESYLKILHYATVEDPPTAATPSATTALAWGGYSVPIARRVGSNLVLINGTVCPTGVAVRLVPDTALRNDLSLTTSGVGAEAIGAGAHTLGSSEPALYNLAVGTVASQTTRLEELVGLNATNHMSVTVGADAAKFDYTTIAAAVAAVAATGGTVNISSGTYIESVTLPATKAITFIGQARPIWKRSAGATAAVITTASGDAQHRFIGLDLQTAEPTYPVIDASVGTSSEDIIFENCSISRSVTSGAAVAIIKTKRALRFASCTLYGADSQYDVLFDVQDPASRLTVEYGYISELMSIVDSGSAAAGTLIFRKNRIRNCGYTPSGSSVSTLFSLAGGSGINICDITDNVWEDTGAATEMGKFIDVLPTSTGVITISNNQILRGMTTTLTATACMVRVRFASNARSKIDNNMIACGKLAAISTSGGVHVMRNKITVTADSIYAIAATICGGVFSQNTIMGSNSASISGVIHATSSTTGLCEISNNDITWSATTTVYGIRAQDVEARIEGNVLAFSGTFTGTGIVCLTTSALVRGNKITGFSSGIAGLEGALTLTDNQIIGSSGVNGINATMDTVTSLHVRGNVIRSFAKGIQLNRSSVWGTACPVITENQIQTTGTGQIGISIGDPTDAFVANNQVTGSGAGDSEGITTGELTHVMLQGNNISNYATGMFIFCHDSIISGNRISACHTPMCFTTTARRCSIIGNRILGQSVGGSGGILFQDVTTPLSLQHVISGNAISGYDVGGGAYALNFGSATNNQNIAVSGNFFGDTNMYLYPHGSVGIGDRSSGATLDHDSVP